MPIKYTDFDTSNREYTGGVTGSARVKRNDGDYYQLKPSILSNNFFRWLKAGGVDRENFGEVIASKIGKGMLDPGYELVPDVSLSHDSDKKEVSVASKYLKGAKVQTLDDYAQDSLGDLSKEDRDKSHVKFTDHENNNPDKREFSLKGDANKNLRKGLARSLAVSILVGDHDVNPGNMMVVDGNVSRIDFGHAFNDLLNAPTMFGGRVRNQENQVMDFFNREKLANFPPPGQQPKLWRDYPGIVPSQEMADALREMSESDKLAKGVESAKAEFKGLLNEIKQEAQEKNDTKDALKTIKHIRASIAEINKAIGAPPIPSGLNPEEYVDRAFDNIGAFCRKNQEQMMDVSKLMQMQVDIDNMLKLEASGQKAPKAQIDNIKSNYAEINQMSGIKNNDNKSITWIKTKADEPAFSGDLHNYIKHRSKQLGIEQGISKDFVKNNFPAAKEKNWFMKFVDYIFGKDKKEKEQSNIENNAFQQSEEPNNIKDKLQGQSQGQSQGQKHDKALSSTEKETPQEQVQQGNTNSSQSMAGQSIHGEGQKTNADSLESDKTKELEGKDQKSPKEKNTSFADKVRDQKEERKNEQNFMDH